MKDRRVPRKTSVILVSTALWTAVLATPVIAAERASELLTQAQQIFGVLPNDMATPEFPVTAERVELGRKLFFDPRIPPMAR